MEQGVTPYQITGPTRYCAHSGRELQPGESIVSALIDDAGQLVRKDFAKDNWQEPPEGTIAFWISRIPASDHPNRPTMNEELLLDCFEHLAETNDPKQQNFRYILTLLLMRKRRLKFEDVQKRPEGEFLLVRDAKNGNRYEILDPHLSESEMESVQNEVFEVLGWN